MYFLKTYAQPMFSCHGVWIFHIAASSVKLVMGLIFHLAVIYAMNHKHLPRNIADFERIKLGVTKMLEKKVQRHYREDL